MVVNMSAETTTSTTSVNAEVMHITSTEHIGNAPRFVYLGSLARGVLLGRDVNTLHDTQGRRFQDVDVVDRLNKLDSKYTLNQGKLDSLHTRTIRPIEPDADVWGFYDSKLPEDLKPFATFPEESMGLAAVHFCIDYPDDVITIPNAATLLALSNIYSYSGLLPKHQDQLAELSKVDSSLDPLFEDALQEYKSAMEHRYPLSTYMQVRRKIFNAHPAIALSVQDGALSAIGKAIRSFRGSIDYQVEEISFDKKPS